MSKKQSKQVVKCAELERELAGKQLDDELFREIERLLDDVDYLGSYADGIRKLKSDVKHWKSNHDCRVEAARILLERSDLPFERTNAYQKHIHLQYTVNRQREQIEHVKAEGDSEIKKLVDMNVRHMEQIYRKDQEIERYDAALLQSDAELMAAQGVAEKLAEAIHSINLCSINSMSSRHEMRRIGDEAIALYKTYQESDSVNKLKEVIKNDARYRALKPLLFCADFAYGDEKQPVIVFQWPYPVSADLDATIDTSGLL